MRAAARLPHWTEGQMEEVILSQCEVARVAAIHHRKAIFVGKGVRTPAMGVFPGVERKDAPKGWVDWMFFGPRRFVFREAKTAGDRLTAEQRRWGRLIIAAGGDWAVLTEDDVRSGRFLEELRSL